MLDFHGQVGDADARPGRPPERNEAAPMPAVSQVVFVQPPAGAAHPRPHGRKTLSLLLLRSPFQAAQSRPATHSPSYRSVLFLTHFSYPILLFSLNLTIVCLCLCVDHAHQTCIDIYRDGRIYGGRENIVRT